MTRICSNPRCRKEYEVGIDKMDDGFCQFDCWEECNCRETETAIEDEEARKELMSYKS